MTRLLYFCSMRTSLIVLAVLFSFVTRAQEMQINDSLDISMSNEEAKVFLQVVDSSNRLLLTPGMQKQFGGKVTTLFYRGGLCYAQFGDSIILFQVMIEGTSNEVQVNGRTLEAGCKRKWFHWRNRSFRSSKEEVERKKGLVETAYTIYKDEETGIQYRVFFRAGRIYDIMLFMP